MPKRINKLPQKYVNNRAIQEKVVELFRAGYNYRQITNETGIYSAVIRYILIIGGVTPKEILSRCGKNKTMTEQDFINVLKMKIETKQAYATICDELGLSATVFYARKKTYDEIGKLDGLMKKAQDSVDGIDLDDPRSAHCRELKQCWDSRCYLHRECPAFAAWEARKTKTDSYSTSIR